MQFYVAIVEILMSPIHPEGHFTLNTIQISSVFKLKNVFKS